MRKVSECHLLKIARYIKRFVIFRLQKSEEPELDYAIERRYIILG